SWGAPQIMGFNAGAAGYITALGMVRAMAESEAEHLAAFVTLILSWGLDAALRSHDWRAFAARYNGSGNVAEYAARIETAYQQLSGRASPVVLRAGARGEAVRRLQVALGLDPDGAFGPETEAAVRRFQAQAGLPIDGVVGARTWAELERRRDASPIRQPAREDRVAQITKVSAAAGGLASAVAAIGDALPESTLNILIGGGMLLALICLAVWAFQRSRGVA
ncbi:N-acetylmuramidase domain-containing protein, partial [Haematobacter sp. UBA3484]|uniref:N-acetylmuramidase domain-containing protein n=1 Tax=Haematobacter sp. UBA3484 TaxID=1946582 RepID=UPI0025C6F513